MSLSKILWYSSFRFQGDNMGGFPKVHLQEIRFMLLSDTYILRQEIGYRSLTLNVRHDSACSLNSRYRGREKKIITFTHFNTWRRVYVMLSLNTSRKDQLPTSFGICTQRKNNRECQSNKERDEKKRIILKKRFWLFAVAFLWPEFGLPFGYLGVLKPNYL